MGNNHKTWYNLGKNPFGIRSYLGNDTFGKLSAWEIIIWEKIHLGKYPTALACDCLAQKCYHYKEVKCFNDNILFVTLFFIVFGSSELQPWAKQTPPTESQDTDQQAQEKLV